MPVECGLGGVRLVCRPRRGGRDAGYGAVPQLDQYLSGWFMSIWAFLVSPDGVDRGGTCRSDAGGLPGSVGE